MSVSMEDRLKRRKLDALKRGIHRVTGEEALAAATHVVGIGKAGIGVITEMLRALEPGSPKFQALAVDIGEQDLSELRSLAATIPAERAGITILAMPVPSRDGLLTTLRRYPEYLTLEYPIYQANKNQPPWLDDNVAMPKSGSHVRRAVAKAIYGQSYYSGSRTLERTLRAFANAIDASGAQAVVVVVFGLGGGTGSGIAVDLSRHLSNGLFGRRVLVAGVGIAPCDGDPPDHAGGNLFPVLNELDCLDDDTKNRGIVSPCGELFRNPFTAGLILVPQQPAWDATHDLGLTQQRGNKEIASLLTIRGGANLWELLRLLNWVAAPSTQHSAARTPWGANWIHILGFADAHGKPIAIGQDLPEKLGLLPSYKPEFIEMRLANAEAEAAPFLADALQQALSPDVPPQVVGSGRTGSVQFILPCVSKLDLRLFYDARTAYDRKTLPDKILDHSLMLERGIVLCEPSTRLQGMAGASLFGSDGWTTVPLADLRGGEASSLLFDGKAQLQPAL